MHVATDAGEAAEAWRRSAFFHLLETGGSLLRVRFHAGETTDFVTFGRMRDEGMSEVVATITRFAGWGAIGEMDCLYSYWATDRAQGFDDAHVEAVAGLGELQHSTLDSKDRTDEYYDLDRRIPKMLIKKPDRMV